MKRIGKLTGRIYDESVDLSKIGECCLVVTDETLLNSEAARLALSRDECSSCRGCPEYYYDEDD